MPAVDSTHATVIEDADPELPPTLRELGCLPLHHGNHLFPHILALHYLSGRQCPWWILGNSSWRRRVFVGRCWTQTAFPRDSAARKRFSRLRPLWRRVYRLVQNQWEPSDNALPSDGTIARMLLDADDGVAKTWWMSALAADRVYQDWSEGRREQGLPGSGVDHFGDQHDLDEIRQSDQNALWQDYVQTAAAVLP